MASAPIEDWRPHLGRKVSLRYKLHGSDHPFSEAIGVISSVDVGPDGQEIVILTRKGESKPIASADILAAKLFP